MSIEEIRGKYNCNVITKLSKGELKKLFNIEFGYKSDTRFTLIMAGDVIPSPIETQWLSQNVEYYYQHHAPYQTQS
ncbi:hypothetical protein DTQ70_03795 [Runella sp. SP2]|nr:hypothetical protein DTQ70_03795 [Runella sp. SP2]